jgi:ABC-type uncharacterized transport system ATPase subunit
MVIRISVGALIVRRDLAFIREIAPLSLAKTVTVLIQGQD